MDFNRLGITAINHMYDDTSLLNIVENRHANGQNCTRISPILLLCVNPRQVDDVCDDIRVYNKLSYVDQLSHLYSTCVNALHDLKESGSDQSIVVCGDVACGKSNICFKLIQFLCRIEPSGIDITKCINKKINSNCLGDCNAMCGDNRIYLSSNDADSSGATALSLIRSFHTILESFGNCVTSKNRNSSRFCQNTYVEYAAVHHSMVGISIELNFLDKNRVIARLDDERSFHIFHQLLAGCSSLEQDQLHMRSKGNTLLFEYLPLLSGSFTSDNNDAVQFCCVRKSLLDLKIISSTSDILILQILSCILHLGNVISTIEEDTFISCKFCCNYEYMSYIEEIIGISGLSTILTSKIMFAGASRRASTTMIYYSKQQIVSLIHSLSKELYNKLFLWLVAASNRSLRCHFGAVAVATKSVGIYDIYGSECLSINSFQQFMRNYSNEKIQHLFSLSMYRYELNVYKEEGVDGIDLVNADRLHTRLQECLKIIERDDDDSILRILEDQCNNIDEFRRDKDSAKYVDIMLSKLYSSNAFVNNNCITVPKDYSTSQIFSIQHYHGKVVYDAKLFVNLSIDRLDQSISSHLCNSSNAFVRRLYDVEASKAADSSSIAGPVPRKKRQFVSEGMDVKLRINEISSQIQVTCMHYIKCIGANRIHCSLFEPGYVLSQLQYHGIVDIISYRNSGLPVRIKYVDLYSFLGKSSAVKGNYSNVYVKIELIKIIEGIISGISTKSDRRLVHTVRYGKTKIFMTRNLYSIIRSHKLSFLAVKIQSIVRMKIAMNLLKLYAKSMLTIKEYLLPWCMNKMRAMHINRIKHFLLYTKHRLRIWYLPRAVEIINHFFSGVVIRYDYLKFRSVVVFIQRFWKQRYRRFKASRNLLCYLMYATTRLRYLRKRAKVMRVQQFYRAYKSLRKYKASYLVMMYKTVLLAGNRLKLFFTCSRVRNVHYTIAVKKAFNFVRLNEGENLMHLLSTSPIGLQECIMCMRDKASDYGSLVHIAIKYGRFDIASMLLQHLDTFNIHKLVDSIGNTCLHLCILAGDAAIDVTTLILDTVSDAVRIIKASNRKGFSSIDIVMKAIGDAGSSSYADAWNISYELSYSKLFLLMNETNVEAVPPVVLAAAGSTAVFFDEYPVFKYKKQVPLVGSLASHQQTYFSSPYYDAVPNADYFYDSSFVNAVTDGCSLDELSVAPEKAVVEDSSIVSNACGIDCDQLPTIIDTNCRRELRHANVKIVREIPYVEPSSAYVKPSSTSEDFNASTVMIKDFEIGRNKAKMAAAVAAASITSTYDDYELYLKCKYSGKFKNNRP